MLRSFIPVFVFGTLWACFTLFLSICSLTLMKPCWTLPSGTFITSKRCLDSHQHHGCVCVYRVSLLHQVWQHNPHFLESAWVSWEVSSSCECVVWVVRVKLTAVAPKRLICVQSSTHPWPSQLISTKHAPKVQHHRSDIKSWPVFLLALTSETLKCTSWLNHFNHFYIWRRSQSLTKSQRSFLNDELTLDWIATVEEEVCFCFLFY